MKFLLADSWAAFSRADANTTLWNLPTHFDADPSLEPRLKALPAVYQDLMALLQREELDRRGAIIRRSIAEWFRLENSGTQFWGFKEITNAGAYDWGCYDQVFPEATWVHIIRHPLAQLRAAARLLGRPLSRETIPGLLRTWLENFETSRQRRTTGRYYEIKYEELCTVPERALSPLLNTLGVRWHDDCRFALVRQWGGRSEWLPLPSEIDALILAVDGLERIMSEYSYRLDSVSSSGTMRRPTPTIEPVGEGRWKLAEPILHEIDRCWEVDLSNAAIADRLAMIADDILYWERSPLRLFEDDKILHPAHALHYQIRRNGAGRFSHWQNRLLFSTSDNSDPNKNGRIYTFDLAGCG